MGTIVQYQQRSNEDRHQRWARLERAELSERYSELHAQGVSQRQAAEVLEVPRSTLQAWRAYQERLDACPAVVAFFQSVPGLAFLHRLVLAIHLDVRFVNTPPVVRSGLGLQPDLQQRSSGGMRASLHGGSRGNPCSCPRLGRHKACPYWHRIYEMDI